MILTTTPSVEGRIIAEYKDIVFGEEFFGVYYHPDFGTNIGDTSDFEKGLIKARTHVMKTISYKASEMGADAVVGIDIDYESFGGGNCVVMVTASGTAVKLAPAHKTD